MSEPLEEEAPIRLIRPFILFEGWPLTLAPILTNTNDARILNYSHGAFCIKIKPSHSKEAMTSSSKVQKVQLKIRRLPPDLFGGALSHWRI